MLKHLKLLVVTAAFLALPGALVAQQATTTCNDGTKSTATGKGACSNHGGVKKSTSSDNKTASKDNDSKGENESASKSSSSTQVKCADGSMSKGGQGACSHHGGVDKGTAASSSKATAPAAAPAAPPKNTSSGKSANASASKEHSEGSGEKPDNNATGATAKCKDGMYSHAKQHSGACSKHGGVDKWMDGSN